MCRAVLTTFVLCAHWARTLGVACARQTLAMPGLFRWVLYKVFCKLIYLFVCLHVHHLHFFIFFIFSFFSFFFIFSFFQCFMDPTSWCLIAYKELKGKAQKWYNVFFFSANRAQRWQKGCAREQKCVARSTGKVIKTGLLISLDDRRKSKQNIHPRPITAPFSP